ncbi:unnamed protein product [Mytilus coruscus]|uniref:Uncharacterized protein n=1 Tax=Mytilus coruscus TaxID=42192 RepID=A0A6J8B219_MYTCO|nr:unnamed protein product [Mytilus coruscus]
MKYCKKIRIWPLEKKPSFVKSLKNFENEANVRVSSPTKAWINSNSRITLVAIANEQIILQVQSNEKILHFDAMNDSSTALVKERNVHAQIDNAEVNDNNIKFKSQQIMLFSIVLNFMPINDSASFLNFLHRIIFNPEFKKLKNGKRHPCD